MFVLLSRGEERCVRLRAGPHNWKKRLTKVIHEVCVRLTSSAHRGQFICSCKAAVWPFWSVQEKKTNFLVDAFMMMASVFYIFSEGYYANNLVLSVWLSSTLELYAFSGTRHQNIMIQ